jgi:hypothetical protein
MASIHTIRTKLCNKLCLPQLVLTVPFANHLHQLILNIGLVTPNLSTNVTYQKSIEQHEHLIRILTRQNITILNCLTGCIATLDNTHTTIQNKAITSQLPM